MFKKGQATIALIILLFVLIVGVVAFVYLNQSKSNPMSTSGVSKTETVVKEDTSKEYTPLVETKDTPTYVDNKSVDELDTLMKDIDSSSDEDLSDLDL